MGCIKMFYMEGLKKNTIHIQASRNGCVKIPSPKVNHNQMYNLDYEHSGHIGFQKELSFDETPTDNSSNPLTSGGAKKVMDKNKIDMMLTGVYPHDTSIMTGSISSNVSHIANVLHNPPESSENYITHESITELSLPEAIEIGEAAFYKSVNYSATLSVFPKVKLIGKYAFQNLAQIYNSDGSYVMKIILPKAIRLYESCFKGSRITKFELPSLTQIDDSVFANNTIVESLDFPSLAETIGNNAFYGCSSLTRLILRRTSGVVPLSSINALSNTPYDSNGAGGIVYVPQALISAYQNAANWSMLYAEGNCAFMSIEGSDYE